MKILAKLAAATAISMLILSASPAVAQQAPARAIVSLYHAAPGQQEALMRWLADQDRVAAAAGVAPSQIYVHTDGASWDFMSIGPVTTEAQDQAIDAAAPPVSSPPIPLLSAQMAACVRFDALILRRRLFR